MRSCVTTSRPVVGSSSTTSGGSQTQAMAIVTPLLLPAGELVGVTPLKPSGRRQLDPLQRRPGPLGRCLAGAVRAHHLAAPHRPPASTGSAPSPDPAARTRRAGRAGCEASLLVAAGDLLAGDLDAAAAQHRPRAACSRAEPARWWSCHCPTRRPAPKISAGADVEPDVLDDGSLLRPERAGPPPAGRMRGRRSYRRTPSVLGT